MSRLTYDHGAEVSRCSVASAARAEPTGDGPLLRLGLAIGVGGLDVEPDDQVLLNRGMFVYDELYAWCARQVGTTPAT